MVRFFGGSLEHSNELLNFEALADWLTQRLTRLKSEAAAEQQTARSDDTSSRKDPTGTIAQY